MLEGCKLLFTLIAENARGDKLQLTQNPAYGVIDVSGLSPAAATVNTSVIATSDGSIYNSSRVNSRNIVITIALIQEPEINRIALYKIFKTKQFCKLYYKNGLRDVFIEGYVESFECGLFSISEQAQISIICPNPFFKNVNSTISYITIDSNAVESTIINNGDIASGVEIQITASGETINPKITNVDTHEYFELYFVMQSGDIINISTYSGEKSITLRRNGTTQNIINSVNRSSVWLQLNYGKNNFVYSAKEGENNLEVTMTHTDLFEGV